MLQNSADAILNSDEEKFSIDDLILKNRALNAAMNGIVITDPNLPDSPIIFCNATFLKLTGYTREEVIGRNSRFLQGPETSKDEIKIIKKALENNEECKVILLNYKKDGTKFWNELSISPVFDSEGKVINHIGIQSDITERINAEAALKRSEEKFRKVVENLDNGIILTDENGIIIEWNKKQEEITGIKAKDILGEFMWNIPDIKSLVNYEETKKSIQNSLKTGEVPANSLEYLTYDKQGNQKVINVTPLSIKTETGFMACNIIRDLTKQKENEAEIRKLSRAVETSPSGILLADLNGNIVYVNPSILEMGNYKEEELLRINIFEFADEKSRKELKEKILPAVLSGEKWSGELIVYRNNGARMPIEISCALVNHDVGQPKFLLAVFNDISERKKAECALKESERKYRNVVDNIKEVIFQTDAEGLWIFLNPAWEEITGFSLEETIGTNFINYVHPEDRERNMKLFKPLICKEKEYCRHTIRYITKEGGYKWIEVFARLTIDDNSNIIGTSGTLNDVTKRKKAEEEIKQTLEKEMELNELKSRFVSTISHEFRTPLTSILASSELLQRYNSKWTDDKKLDTLKRIEKSVLYMNEMINDVLTLNRAETGRLIFNPSETDIVQISKIIFEEVKLIAKPEHKLISDFSSEKIIAVIDEKLIRHVINNLLTNAVKYSPKGGSIYFSLIRKEKNIEITIKDEGIGISADDQKKLFQPFFRGSNIENISGTGLGLSILQRAVALHNGTIDYKSELYKGTTFVVKIPVENEDEKNISN